jgi:uncharacterized protein YdaU (DUF1376 family)
MAKDPAFLFYTGDFSTGTQFFSDEELGKYLRLLMAQHQHGHLSEEEVIHICKSLDCKPVKKFIKDAQGLYYNARLEKEINLRKAFTESRSNNRKGKGNQSDNTKKKSKRSVKHMEDENKDENKDTTKKKSKGENHLFSNSPFMDFEKFEAEFKGTAYELCDLKIYHEKVKSWSAAKGEKRIDWIATTRTFILGDKEKGKLILKDGTKQVSQSEQSAGNAADEYVRQQYASK